VWGILGQAAAKHGCARRGPPFRIWQEAISRSFISLVSPAILREIADVLRENLQWQELDIVAYLKLVARIA
jgi:hypothetical protein